MRKIALLLFICAIPVAQAQVDAPPAYPRDGAIKMLENDRVRVWEYDEDFSSIANTEDSVHYHGHDAVVVWFDTDTQPNVVFISRGTIHSNDIPTAAVGVFIFEIL
jgi:hypothetical protein